MKCQLVLGVVPPCTRMGKIEALASSRHLGFSEANVPGTTST